MILARSLGPLEKARALTYWVRKSVRYISISSTGHGYVPRQPQQVFTSRYGELMHVSRTSWCATRGKDRDEKVRRQLADQMRSMVTAAGDAIEGLPARSMQTISFDRLADHFLVGIADDRPAWLYRQRP